MLDLFTVDVECMYEYVYIMHMCVHACQYICLYVY